MHATMRWPAKIGPTTVLAGSARKNRESFKFPQRRVSETERQVFETNCMDAGTALRDPRASFRSTTY